MSLSHSNSFAGHSVVIPAQPGYAIAQYCGDEAHSEPLAECLSTDPIIAWRIYYRDGEGAFWAAITIEQGETLDACVLCPDGKVHSAGGETPVDVWLAARRKEEIKRAGQGLV